MAVRAETVPCPHCGFDLTRLRWSKDAPYSWLEENCLNVTECPDCEQRLPSD